MSHKADLEQAIVDAECELAASQAAKAVLQNAAIFAHQPDVTLDEIRADLRQRCNRVEENERAAFETRAEAREAYARALPDLDR